eukprot:scaffold3291_cov94-Skeletonema_dohrnii-CCMP3373.AAC.7
MKIKSPCQRVGAVDIHHHHNIYHVQHNPLHCSKVGAMPPSCTRRPSLPELRHSCSSIAAAHRANSRCTPAAHFRNGRATPPSIAAMGEQQR